MKNRQSIVVCCVVLREDVVTYTLLDLLEVVHLLLGKASIPNRGCVFKDWANIAFVYCEEFFGV